jgi:sugar/nucleoside kinase (ribokinase family)
MGPEVVCLGAVNVDLLYRVEDLAPFLQVWPRLQPGGEVPLTPAEEAFLQKLLAQHARFQTRCGGGQAANTAWALARMGVSVALVGRVGADADGDFLLEGLAGVDWRRATRAGASGRAYILVDSAGERTILVAPNTNDELKEEDIPWKVFETAKFLHLTSFVGDEPLRAQEKLARRLEGWVRLSLDPGELYARRGREALLPLLAWLETLFVTEAEWRLLGGELDSLPAWAPPVVLIKRGPRGARLLTRRVIQDFPAEATEQVVDTLGAGDVFAAGFLAGQAAGLPLEPAVRLAVRAAGHSLAGTGRERYPDKAFLETQLRQLG